MFQKKKLLQSCSVSFFFFRAGFCGLFAKKERTVRSKKAAGRRREAREHVDSYQTSFQSTKLSINRAPHREQDYPYPSGAVAALVEQERLCHFSAVRGAIAFAQSSLHVRTRILPHTTEVS